MKILIIEDEKELRLTLRQFLEQEHFLVETAKDYTSGLSKLADYDYDCILLDIMLPNGSGMQLLDELKAMKKKTLGIDYIGERLGGRQGVRA